MFSKNNRFAMERKMSASKQRFGLRKLSVGVASVLLGLTFLYGTKASADTVSSSTPPAASSQLVTNTPASTVEDSSVETAQQGTMGTTGSVEQEVIQDFNSTSIAGQPTAPAPVINSSSPVPPAASTQTMTSPAEDTNGETPVTSPVTPPATETNNFTPVFEIVLDVLDADDNNRHVESITIWGSVGDTIDLSQYADRINPNLVLQAGTVTVSRPGERFNIYVNHRTEERWENRVIEQVIYGQTADGQVVRLDYQTVEFKRLRVWDAYTRQFIETHPWVVAQQKFNDYQVDLSKHPQLNNYSAEKMNVVGTTVNPDSARRIELVVKLAENRTETEEKTVNRVINIHHHDGTVEQKIQSVAFSRDVIYNPFTGDRITTGSWSYRIDGGGLVQGDVAELPALELPEISGKKPLTTVDKLTVTPEMADQTVDVWYEATLQPQEIETSTVNRVIHHYYPDGRVEQVTHTVSFTRPVYLNLQTSLLEYGNWEGPTAFDDYLVPELAGHTPSVDKIVGAEVRPGHLDADHVHHVYYTALPNAGGNQPGGSGTGTQPETGTENGNTGSTSGDQQGSQPAPVMTAASHKDGGSATQTASSQATASGAAVTDGNQNAALPATGADENQAAMVAGAVLLGLMAQLLTFGLLRHKKINE